MHVTNVRLDRFKGFTQSESTPPTTIPLANSTTLIIGPNCSGKTSILQLLAIGGWVCKENRKEDETFDSGPNTTINSPFATILAGSIDSAIPVNSSATHASIHLDFSDGSSISIRFRRNELLVSAPKGEATPALRVTYVPRDLSFPGQTDEKRRTDDDLAQSPTVADGNLTANYCAYLQNAMKLGELDEMMDRVFPGIGKLDLVILKNVYRLRFKRDESVFPWYQEGSGVAFVLTIFAAILYDIAKCFASMQDVAAGNTSKPYQYMHLLALDEPTSPLHPQVLSAFVTVLESLKVQIVIATHSVDFLLASSILPFPNFNLVSLSDSPPSARRQLTDDLLESLGLTADAITSALPAHPMKTSTLASLSAFNRLLYVEGKNDVDMLRVFMEVYDEHRAAAFCNKVIIEFFSTCEKVGVYADAANRIGSILEGWRASKEDREKKREVAITERLGVVVLVDRNYRPDILMNFEAQKFSQLVGQSQYLAGGDGSFWCDWGAVAEWENHIADLEVIRSLLRAAESPHAAKLDDYYGEAVAGGKDKLAEEFGHYLTVAKGDKAFAAALKSSSPGDALQAMLRAFDERPSSYIDAKRLLRSVGFKDVQAWRELAVAIGRKDLPLELQNLVEHLFTWAGV
ncbi:hypothetical protein HK097_010754 [Rhizophlyctis rosea]|uniref:ATPase AAA-type core domain-containing protein n=1 Tax=Rhizophlyctis rosea TaxID=64517 RepID=A0AAD5S8L4_9FUNG|nr:hypothetical protein HK097_010754 [Rhizophlyctis rosea]